ncbi:MAG: FAD-dependent oxidoreductase [Desulfobacterales bacterium]|nr:FAD-dependent oxidoreductase [Desulfobacterales bacterium]
MERLLAPHGPYNRVLRPSDGMEPDSIAYVQCAGSRDKSMGVPYCSRVCCMYAIKQAMLLSGSLPLADITIYYMDIRAFGKGYEQFYQNAKAMGIEFVKAKVARIDAGENGSAQVRYENQDGSGIATADHDLVVLSMGMIPGWNPDAVCPVSKDSDQFITSIKPKISPVLTDMDGVFVAGAAAGPKDIVDTITESGSAAMEAAKFMSNSIMENSR